MPTLNRRRLLRLGSLSSAAAVLPRESDAPQRSPIAWTARASGDMPPPDRAALMLSRAAFGARPGELAALRQPGGVDAWLERQLDPAGIDDSAVETVLASQLPSLAMPAPELWALSQERGQINPIVQGLRIASLYRQIFSQRQLFEVMVDFWSDHLSINQAAGNPRVLKTVDDRDVIRRHALGRFRDLLGASAHSPAMLLYLDNDSNTRRAPNENYARELMELHSLGVAREGQPYSETDVKEVARCFTGWTWNPGRQDADQAGRFAFNAGNHDQGVKTVLGQPIPANLGQRDGDMVIDLLCSHPATARFLATKLVRRFVADDPLGEVPALVDAVAKTYADTDGDIKAMLRTILRSETFAGSFATHGGKLSRPMDHVVRALRGLDLQPADLGADFAAREFTGFVAALIGGAGFLTRMNHVPFTWETPDGFPDIKEKWTSTGLLLARWNFGLALVEGGVLRGYAPTAGRPASLSTAGAIVDFWTERLLHRALLPEDRAGLVDYLADGAGEDGPPAAGREPYLLALILDSPYFVWR
ncbi:MAG: DUF1800 domain-containing protein [Caldilineae bacterium]|nr:DUF1800 domain-containing protein [Caldilineae bacterium]